MSDQPPPEMMEVELLSGAKVQMTKEQAQKEIEARQKYKTDLRAKDEELGKYRTESQARIDAAEKARQDAEAQAAIKAGELDKAREIYEKQHVEKLNKIEKNYRTSRLEQLVSANATVIPEAAKDIAASLLHSCKFNLESEQLEVIGADGKSRTDQNGKPLSVDALIAEHIEARPYLRKATTPSGSGAAGGAGNKTARTITRSEFEAMPQKERAAFFADGGKLRDN